MPTATDTRVVTLARAARSMQLAAAVRLNVRLAWASAYEERIRPWRLLVRATARHRKLDPLAALAVMLAEDASLTEGPVPMLLLAAALDEAQALRCDGCEEVADPPWTAGGAGSAVPCAYCAARAVREAPETAAAVRLLTDEERAVCERGNA